MSDNGNKLQAFLLVFNGLFMILVLALETFRMEGSSIQNAIFVVLSICAAMYLYVAFNLNKHLKSEAK